MPLIETGHHNGYFWIDYHLPISHKDNGSIKFLIQIRTFEIGQICYIFETRMKFLPVASLCLISTLGNTQLNVLPGTSITVNSGTSIQILTDGDTLHVNSPSFINNGIINLDTSASISDSLFPISGTGYEERTQNILSSTQNIGGLGFNISPITTVNNAIVRRKHAILFIGPGQ